MGPTPPASEGLFLKLARLSVYPVTMPEAEAVQPARPTNEDETRRLPLIIRVPPPRTAGSGVQPWVFWIVVVSIGLAPVIPAVALLLALRPPWAVPGLGGALLAGVIMVVVVWRVARRYQQRLDARWSEHRREYDARSRDVEPDPVAAAISRKWHRRSHLPESEVVLEAIRAHPPPRPPRARVVCLGPMDIPEVGDLRFEPVIITPTRYLWRRLWIVPLAVALFGLWLFGKLGAWPGLEHMPLGAFGYFLVVGIAAAAVWVWRTAIHPTYLRLAPGMLQVVEFGLGKAKPTIRSYPMQPGTVAIMINPSARPNRRLTLTLARGENGDEIPLWQMQQPAEAAERIWQALLSTAPTPPLSDEELVG